MKRLISFVVAITLGLGVAAAKQAPAVFKPFTIDDLIKIRRVADPQLSPDGRSIAFTITDTDKAANKRTTQIYFVPTEGGEPVQVTNDKQSSSSPRWSPDGKRLAFVSAREGAPQIWTVEMGATASGPARRITNISTGADGPVWSPDGQLIAFTSEIYPECSSDECNRKREEAAAQSKVKAKIADQLLYRHWNSWKEGKRTHVFVVNSGGGEARDMTPGNYDAPPFSLGGPVDYAFSPDSKELAFARNTDKVEAISTNTDVFVTLVGGGEARRLTGHNPAADQSPQYSPDGRYLAYRAQAKQGFESDRWRLVVYDRKTNQGHSITEQLDSSVEGFTFSPDSQRVYLTALERGRQPVFEVSLTGGPVKKIIGDAINDDVQVAPDGKTLIFTRNSMTRAVEVFRASADGGAITQITKVNDASLAPFNLKAAEDITWEGAAGSKVHGFMIKPANFTPTKKWPLVVLIHGGPQGAWNDAWSYRWNPQVFAAAGYVVFAPNPRGSTGYGQKFVDEISGDWGGKVFEDLLNGVAHVSSMPYIDRERIAAAGGSYGGYMVNWILGHNDDRAVKFKALVSHAGVYNLTSMYGATEELWFTEWEFKGTPWTNQEMYTKWSPHMHVKNFKTPTLVVHGELDYRVPVTEGIQLFTALQRQGVESRLLYYPDEGHWILKPQNSQLWYDTVINWFDTYLKPKTES
ncbi:MAG TPA: S9 family peptidase [Blastocatellia bacterium]|jgi:dipeptidyl aminopeptidase/acylaminoacyl peptidase|nr:S9 family peptidase [Blastocatellia bacterium]